MTETLWHPSLDNLEARRIILTGRQHESMKSSSARQEKAAQIRS